MTQLPARTDEEWKALLADPATGFIRTYKDWVTSLTAFTSVVRLFGDTATHPAAGLDKETLEAFTNSLIFRGGGLAHAAYRMLQDKLTEPQFQQLWESFGIAPSLFVDCRGHFCAGDAPRSCVFTPGSLCLSNC